MTRNWGDKEVSHWKWHIHILVYNTCWLCLMAATWLRPGHKNCFIFVSNLQKANVNKSVCMYINPLNVNLKLQLLFKSKYYEKYQYLYWMLYLMIFILKIMILNLLYIFNLELIVLMSVPFYYNMDFIPGKKHFILISLFFY